MPVPDSTPALMQEPGALFAEPRVIACNVAPAVCPAGQTLAVPITIIPGQFLKYPGLARLNFGAHKTGVAQSGTVALRINGVVVVTYTLATTNDVIVGDAALAVQLDRATQIYQTVGAPGVSSTDFTSLAVDFNQTVTMDWLVTAGAAEPVTVDWTQLVWTTKTPR